MCTFKNSNLNHKLHTLAANDLELLRGADAVVTSGAHVLAVMGLSVAAHRRESVAVAGIVAADDADAARLIAVDFDFVDTVKVVNDPLKQADRKSVV